MGTANRAYGTTMHPSLSFKPEPGQNIVAYVRDSQSDGDTADVAAKRYTTLNAALAVCRSGHGDTVVVLPGHTESFASADSLSNLVAGTQIVGLGAGNLRPTFTWTAAASSVLIDVANVTIDNCILNLGTDGSGSNVTVAAPMTVSAAGFTLRKCRALIAFDAGHRATVAIATTAAASDMLIEDCYIHGDSDGTGVTTAIQVVGSARFAMRNSYVIASTSATTVGVLQFVTTASLGVSVSDCVFANYKALSDTAVTGHATSRGVFKNCGFAILDTATTTGADTVGLFQFVNCQTTNTAGDGGADVTPVST